MRKTTAGVLLVGCCVASPADAQWNNRAIALGVAASGIYAAVGSVEGPRCRPGDGELDPRDGICKSGWYNYELSGRPLFYHGPPTRRDDYYAIGGGLVVSAIGAYFAVRPASDFTELVSGEKPASC